MTDEIDRGVRAEKLINDPLLTEAFTKVEEAIWAAFKTSPARDAEGREHLYQRLKALTDARGYLEQVMRDGKVAIHLKEEKKRLFNFR
jgi:hypothetical protein